MEQQTSSLVLALGGFSIAETEQSELPAPPAATGHARQARQVAAGTAALVDHARTIANRALERWQEAGSDMLEQEGEALASLCFALQAMLGPSTRLADADERNLFDLASALWGASLQALSAGGAAEAASAPLDRMGSDLFALVDGDSDATQDCARYVAYFSAAARSWAAAGQREKAGWCVQRAMRYSQQLEALVGSEEVGVERKEGYVVSLFNLYIEAAKSSADNKQQALATNLLSRAVQLSRHAAVGPDAAACCAMAVAELQLEQARHMFAKGGTMCGLAAALLTSSYQQLTTGDLQSACMGGGPHAAGLMYAKKQVLALLCKAHLASGDAGLASKVLDALEGEAPGAAAADPGMQLVYVEAKVGAGRVPEALRFLMALIQKQQADPAADAAPGAADAAAATFLAGLRLALRHISDDTLPSFQSAVSAFVWRATAASPPTPLLGLVQTLLAQEQGSELCHRLALQVLGSEDVSAAAHRDAAVLAQVHGLLFHRAAHCLEAGSCSAAKELFGAALQFARPEARAKNARALAVCHSRLGTHQRAAEYLAIAARHEQQPSSLTQLARLQALAETGDAVQAVAAIRSLTSCLDFHPSLIAAMCQAAAKAQHPAVYKEALSSATQLLIKPEAATSSLPAGQEAALLLGLVRAIDACLRAAAPAAEAGTGAPAGGSMAALYGELLAGVKLVARRLKLLGWRKFVGASQDEASTVQAICATAYNQLLAAQQHGAHEHVVALATTLFQLLPLADQHLRVEATGAAQQARVLMLAQQALLDLHAVQSEGGQKLALAAKLQARLAQHMPCLAPEQHPQLHLLHHILCLETAARQGDGAALLQCISKLQAHAGQLTAAQRASILSTVCSQHSMVVQEAAARLLLDSMAADGGLPAMSLLPAMLGQLSLSAEMRLRAVCRCRQLLAAMPLESRDSSWIQCTEWLAVHAWNEGTKLARRHSAGRSEQTAELIRAAVQLQEACAPGGADKLRRMRAAVAAAGLDDGAVSAAGAKVAEGGMVVAAAISGAPLPSGSASVGAIAEPARPPPAADTAQPTVSGAEQCAAPPRPAAGATALEPVAHSASSSPHASGGAAAPPAVAARAGHVVQDMSPQPPIAAAAAACQAPPHAAALPEEMADAAAVPGPAASDAVLPTPASMSADEEDGLSDSDGEGDAPGGGWLASMLAAHKRALGDAGDGPAKRQAVAGPLGRRAAAPASFPSRRQRGPPEQPAPADVDGADALSLADSMPGGFMAL